MKHLLSFFVLLSISFASEAEEKEKLTLGFGPYIQSQAYKNVDDMVLASPVFFYDNELLYVRWTRFGIYFMGQSTDEFSWGFSLTAQPRTNGYSPDDSLQMRGMLEKESSWEGGIAFSASYKEGYIEMMYLHDLLDRYDAYIAKAELGYTLKFEKISFYPSLVCIYQSGDFLNYYYGVSNSESAASIYATYTPESDYKFAAQSYINYPITDKISAFFNLRVDILSGEAKNSPLTEKDYYYSGIASLIYTFEF